MCQMSCVVCRERVLISLPVGVRSGSPSILQLHEASPVPFLPIANGTGCVRHECYFVSPTGQMSNGIASGRISALKMEHLDGTLGNVSDVIYVLCCTAYSRD